MGWEEAARREISSDSPSDEGGPLAPKAAEQTVERHNTERRPAFMPTRGAPGITIRRHGRTRTDGNRLGTRDGSDRRPSAIVERRK